MELKSKLKEPSECKICKKTFSPNFGLKSHEKVHTGEIPFECKTCKEAFTKSDELKQHEKCPLCVKSQLRNHLMKMKNQKAFLKVDIYPVRIFSKLSQPFKLTSWQKYIKPFSKLFPASIISFSSLSANCVITVD